MTDHLTDLQVEGYRNRCVLPEELLAIDEHTSWCSQCALLIRDPHRVRESLELWRSDFAPADTGPPGHISYEQQAAYVDEATGATEREIVESHLKACARCSEEIGDLKRFSAQFTNVAAVPNFENAERRSPQLFERFMGLWRRPRLWIPLQLAATAAAIILFAWFLTASIRRQNAELKTQLASAQHENQAVQQQNNEASATIENLKSQIAELQQSDLHDASPEPENRIAVALNDGDGQVTLDRAGNLTGLQLLPPAWQQTVKTALMTERIQTPPAVSNLIGKTGVLMGGSGEGIAFSLLGPVGTAVATDRPVFRWGAVSGATSYLVAVHDSNFNWVATSQPITTTTWTSTSPLRRGETYFWQVTAIRDGKEIKSPVPPAPEARFKVIEQSKAEELSQLKRASSNSHLAVGLIYVKEGLLDDAQREFETLARANPKSTVAQKLLSNLKAIRQAKR